MSVNTLSFLFVPFLPFEVEKGVKQREI